MTKQRTALEFSDKDKRLRAIMEQTSREYKISDVPDALDCLLDMLGGRNIDVLKMVQDLLITRARQRFETQRMTAYFLGSSPRKLHYHISERHCMDVDRILRDYKELEAKLYKEIAEAKELQKVLKED